MWLTTLWRMETIVTIILAVTLQRTLANLKALKSLKEFDPNNISAHNFKMPIDNETNYFLRQTKENLIRAFGLRHNMVEIGSHIKQREPHKYMIHIAKKYEQLYKTGQPLSANTVRGCVDLGHGDKRLADFPHVSFKFDVSEIPKTETLVQSELKILMKHEDFGLKVHKTGKFILQVFGVIPRNKKENRKEHKHSFPTLLDMATKHINTVKGQTERWISFDVTAFVNIIRNFGRKHVKFVIRAKPLGGTDIDPKLIGVNNHIKFETEKGLLVIFSGDDEPEVLQGRRRKRDISGSSKSSKRRNRNKQKRRKNKKNKGRKKACRRKNMVVHFNDFGWSNFLIKPREQNLYYCHGNCNYPVPSHIKTSNHATIQSITHATDPKLVPPPCCVPDEYDVLPVLSLDGPDRVVFKLKEGLIVKSCACR